MSYHERLMELSAGVPESMAATAFFLLKTLLDAKEDELDNAFCLRMEEAFEADPDPEKWEGVSIEALAARWGVALD